MIESIPREESAEQLVGRRRKSRARVALSSRFVAGKNAQTVQIEDLSVAGARLKLTQPETFISGTLYWLGYRAFAKLIWRDNGRCAVAFERELDTECLRQTTKAAQMLASNRGGKFSALASAWVPGSEVC